uniref:Uncharacterized protein n=2 Tax=Alexandrium monilatum TaxID=311494 RepID=A0A7S4Q8M0_9DINO
MITNRHQRGVPRKKSVRPGAVGVQPDDSAGMQRKLQERWNPELRVRALEKKVEEYADRHGGMEQLLRTHDTETTDPELDILKKMVADGKQQLQKLPSCARARATGTLTTWVTMRSVSPCPSTSCSSRRSRTSTTSPRWFSLAGTGASVPGPGRRLWRGTRPLRPGSLVTVLGATEPGTQDPKGAEGLQLDCNATNGRLREVYKQFTSLPGRVYASRAALARVDALCGPGAPSPLPAFAASLLACRLPGGPSPAVFGAILAGSAVASAALSAWPWLARRLHSGGSGSQRLLAA